MQIQIPGRDGKDSDLTQPGSNVYSAMAARQVTRPATYSPVLGERSHGGGMGSHIRSCGSLI